MYIVMLSPFPFVGKHATQHLVILFKFVLKVETLQCAIFFSFTKQYPTLTSSIKLGQVSALRLRTGQLKELPQRLQHSGHGSMGAISLRHSWNVARQSKWNSCQLVQNTIPAGPTVPQASCTTMMLA